MSRLMKKKKKKMTAPSLIRDFALRMKKTWALSYPFSAQRRLWLDWADAQADLGLPFCWFCHHVFVVFYDSISLYVCFVVKSKVSSKTVVNKFAVSFWYIHCKKTMRKSIVHKLMFVHKLMYQEQTDKTRDFTGFLAVSIWPMQKVSTSFRNYFVCGGVLTDLLS